MDDTPLLETIYNIHYNVKYKMIEQDLCNSDELPIHDRQNISEACYWQDIKNLFDCKETQDINVFNEDCKLLKSLEKICAWVDKHHELKKILDDAAIAFHFTSSEDRTTVLLMLYGWEVMAEIHTLFVQYYLNHTINETLKNHVYAYIHDMSSISQINI